MHAHYYQGRHACRQEDSRYKFLLASSNRHLADAAVLQFFSATARTAFIATSFGIPQFGLRPAIIKLGVVGYTQAGKTTFLEQALHRESSTTRTNNVYATILSLQSSSSGTE